VLGVNPLSAALNETAPLPAPMSCVVVLEPYELAVP
jgi:hypothetical protein